MAEKTETGKGKVGIVGSGLIGRSYAMLFVGAGFDDLFFGMIFGWKAGQ